MIAQFEEYNFTAVFSEDNYEFKETEEQITATLTEDSSFVCNFSSADFICDFGGGVRADYDGPYTVTPSQQTQTLSTANKTLAHNVIVNPIPSNYGLITWNGRVLTVS